MKKVGTLRSFGIIQTKDVFLLSFRPLSPGSPLLCGINQLHKLGSPASRPQNMRAVYIVRIGTFYNASGQFVLLRNEYLFDNKIVKEPKSNLINPSVFCLPGAT